MARRMIDPQTIIKSQIVDDKYSVDLNEILEKYGVEFNYKKSVTLQFYSKETLNDNYFMITCNRGKKGEVVLNSAITITKNDDRYVYISGLIVDDLATMNLLPYIEIANEDYEEFGIKLSSEYLFDVHVIKV